MASLPLKDGAGAAPVFTATPTGAPVRSVARRPATIDVDPNRGGSARRPNSGAGTLTHAGSADGAHSILSVATAHRPAPRGPGSAGDRPPIPLPGSTPPKGHPKPPTGGRGNHHHVPPKPKPGATHGHHPKPKPPPSKGHPKPAGAGVPTVTSSPAPGDAFGISGLSLFPILLLVGGGLALYYLFTHRKR